MHVSYVSQVSQVECTMQLAKDDKFEIETQQCKREDELNEFYFDFQDEEDQLKQEMTYSQPAKYNESVLAIQSQKQRYQVSAQLSNTCYNLSQNQRYYHTKNTSQRQSLQSHLSSQLTEKSESQFKNQQAMHRAEQILDLQLQEYLRRNQMKKSHSEQSQRSVCSTKTTKIKAQTKKQVNFEPKIQSAQRSTTKRKKRTFISEKVIGDAVEMFEKRKSNPLINLDNIAEKLNVGYTTVCKLYKEWSRDHRLLGRVVHIEKQKVKKIELDQLRMKVLERVLYLNPYLQQSELVQEMNKFSEIKQSKAAITRFIIYELLKNAGYIKKRSKKHVLQSNNQSVKQERKNFCKVYKQIITQQQFRVFFLGELFLNIYDAREEGWCKEDQDLIIRCPIIKSKSVSALFFVHKNGSFVSQVKVGSLQTHELIMTVANILKDNEPKGESERRYLIVDTANLQTEIDFYELGNHTNCQILKVPAYSPQLSIMQYFFSHLKFKLKYKKLNNEFQLKEQIQRLVKQDQSKRLANYFQRMELHLADILSK